jgi:hypothetical protein
LLFQFYKKICHHSHWHTTTKKHNLYHQQLVICKRQNTYNQHCGLY